MIPGGRVLIAWFVFLVAGLALCGCSTKPVPLPDLGPDAAQAVWLKFQSRYMDACPARDFSMRASVNYSSKEQHTRVVLSMWGRMDYPIRLDIQAGVGAMLAHWREDEHGWVGYSPARQEAYIHNDVRGGAEIMGLFMPVRLDALARLLSGCWQTIVPMQYSHASMTGEHIAYTFHREEAVLSLLLSRDGRPLSVGQEGPDAWRISIDQWLDETSRVPGRISLQQNAQSAVVRMQRMDLAVAPWQDQDLSLDLPPGTKMLYLAP
jgi:hypothetical protein